MNQATTASTEAKVMQLVPYIFFYGRCEEALEFYKHALRGTYEVLRNGDSPMRDEVAADFRDKIMHASFSGAGIKFMASDGREPKQIDPEAGNISLALTSKDNAEGER
ncbi:MAG: VOC family protein, partial [Candidatus Eremiobacteraeota bacterium]|nr:VOC family protein [Candidatus Eremiobacteraeota bacterium]MDQ6933159.1 VOC family protein [Candidatus Eremiobacteraeota bacterium]